MPSATSSPRSSARSPPARSSSSRSSQAAVTAGITKPGTGITDIGALILEIVFTAGFIAGHPGLDQARARARGAGHPADARRDPLRHGDAERRLGQPGPLDRLGRGRRRPEPAVDLPRGPDRRRASSAGPRGGDRRRRGGAGRPDRGRGGIVAYEILEAEPAGVAHLAPDAGLGDGQHLADVIAVVVDPLAQQFVDP